MSSLLALSFDNLSSPSVSLKGSKLNRKKFGWGFGWYPDDSYSATVIKDNSQKGYREISEVITDWESFRSTVFMCESSGDPDEGSVHEAQPFSFSFAGQDWMFLHDGQVNREELEKRHNEKSGLLVPKGKTDSELLFLYLLGKIRVSGARDLASTSPQNLLSWLEEVSQFGSLDIVLTDRNTMIAYHSRNSKRNLFYKRVVPGGKEGLLGTENAQVKVDDPRDTFRTWLAISSEEFQGEKGTLIQPGELIVVRRGVTVWKGQLQAVNAPQNTKNSFVQQKIPQQAQQLKKLFNIRSLTHAPDGSLLGFNTYELTHRTHYTYDKPVEGSVHTFRLHPVEDHLQEVSWSEISVSVDGEDAQFDDVFGNQTIHYRVDKSYKDFEIISKSHVKLYGRAPDEHQPLAKKTTIPLVWMPWQRQMMMPYLLPPELPETQLRELTDYAMSFVERSDYNLIKTLKDMNQRIYQDYQYLSGSTTLETTPFEVFTSRRGVCQDFANLFICLARLLSVPARYRVGYIYTGVNYENKIQSEASHAWAEVYLPFLGWRGFDPTNGCLVEQDHIRIACGRNYRDATPTSGTLLKGGGGEKLSVDVKLIRK